MLHQIIISIASNHEQKLHLSEARQLLGQLLTPQRYTDEIWTKPCGKPLKPDLYLNQLLYASTSLSVEELQNELKALERRMGRTAEDRQEGIVRIDLDLMEYDGRRYHQSDWERPYMRLLLLSQT